MVGAACIQHESLNRFVVSASSRPGLLVDTSFGAGAAASLPCALMADGLHDFVSGVKTVPAPGPTVTSIGHRVVSGGAQTAHAFAGSKGNIGILEVLESSWVGSHRKWSRSEAGVLRGSPTKGARC